MGMIYYSRKELVWDHTRGAVEDPDIWVSRGMVDFLPYKTWWVPFDGERQSVPHREIREMVIAMERQANPSLEIIDAYVSVRDQHLIITVGIYAT